MRLRGVTLLEMLVALALVGLLFAVLIPVLRLGAVSLEASTKAAQMVEQVALRRELRRAFQNVVVGKSVRGDTTSVLLYTHAAIAALPEATTQLFTVSIEGTAARIQRVALAADQSVLSEEERHLELGLEVAFSFLPPCTGPDGWRDTWQENPPLALRMTTTGDAFWPEFLAARPKTTKDGC